MIVFIPVFNFRIFLTLDDSIAARSKAWGCGRSLAGIAGSNPAGGRSVVCCQAEVSLVQGSPTESPVSERDRDAPIMRRPYPNKGFCATEKENSWPSPTLAARYFVMSEITRHSRTSRNTRILSNTDVNTSIFSHLRYSTAHLFGKFQFLFGRVRKIANSAC